MKVQYICCAGLDVHKRIVVACVIKGAFGEEVISKLKSFGTTNVRSVWGRILNSREIAFGLTSSAVKHSFTS
jgi:hypothetical protein